MALGLSYVDLTQSCGPFLEKNRYARIGFSYSGGHQFEPASDSAGGNKAMLPQQSFYDGERHTMRTHKITELQPFKVGMGVAWTAALGIFAGRRSQDRLRA